MHLHDFEVVLDLQREGFPQTTGNLVHDQLSYLDAHETIVGGRRVLALRVRAVDADSAITYARQRVALELHLLTAV